MKDGRTPGVEDGSPRGPATWERDLTGTKADAFFHDLWHLAGLHSGRELPCTSAKTALLYALSPRTQGTMAKSYSAYGRDGGFVDLRIVGPIADDGGKLLVSYRLTRRAWAEDLDAADREALRTCVASGETGAPSAGFRAALKDEP